MTKDEALKSELIRKGIEEHKINAELRAEIERLKQRTWVGLTAKEKHEIRYSHMTSAEFIECIEAKLKEKNGIKE